MAVQVRFKFGVLYVHIDEGFSTNLKPVTRELCHMIIVVINACEDL
jgi:hypothetical protein